MPVEPISESPILLSRRPKGSHLESIVDDHMECNAQQLEILLYVEDVVLYESYFEVCTVIWV